MSPAGRRTARAGDDVVTVAVPYFGCGKLLTRAVQSILNQQRVALRCIVVNDGDYNRPPWPLLQHIRDPRLIRFDLPANRGRYFVDAVTAAATPGGWWSPHDADDWSEPHRLATLLAAARAGTQVVLGAHRNHYRSGRQRVRRVKPLRHRRLRFRTHLSGLWRPKVAAALTHPGWRIEWAAAMTSAALLATQTAVVQQPLYHRVLRARSLVTAADTGHHSPYRRRQRRRMRRLWHQIVEADQPAGSITVPRIARIIHADIDPQLRAEVEHHAARLREALEAT